MKPLALTRAVGAALAGGALVWGANGAHGSVDATRPADDAGAAVTRSVEAARQTRLTCPGPDRPGAAGSVGSKQGAQLTVAATPRDLTGTTRGAAGGATLQRGVGRATDLRLRPAGVVTSRLRGAATATVSADRSLAVGLSATQTIADDDVSGRGIGTAQCTGPVRDAWLFGGGAADGRLARLVLANPGSAAVTVDAALVGSAGVDRGKSATDVVLGPGERQVLVLGALPRALAQPAVHVTASGGGVIAALTDVELDGETPRGQDVVTPVASTGRELRFPAVRATSAAPLVRVAVPGAADAVVRVRAVSLTGEVVVDEVRTVRGGRVASTALADLPAGDYAVRVTSDEPVAAAVLSRTAETGRADLAWAVAAPAISGPGSVALPTDLPRQSAALLLVADRSTPVQVRTLVDGRVRSQQVTVPADRPLRLRVSGAAAVWVRPAGGERGGPVHAAVRLSGDDGSQRAGALLTAVPVLPAATAAGALVITPHR